MNEIFLKDIKKCNSCGKVLPSDSAFCQYCGSSDLLDCQKPVVIKKFCCICGKELPKDSIFCQYCGSKEISEKEIAIKTIKVCDDCGKILPDDSVFCQYCGSEKISEVEDSRDHDETQKEEMTTLTNKFFSKSKSRSSIRNRTKTKKRSLIIFLVLAAVIALSYLILFSAIGVDEQRIINGVTIINTLGNDQASRIYPIKVVSRDDESVYVYIKEVNSRQVQSFLVKEGNSKTIYLPDGKYRVYYATGDIWYGERKLFGLGTKCYKQTSELNTVIRERQLTISFKESAVPIKRILRFLFGL